MIIFLDSCPNAYLILELYSSWFDGGPRCLPFPSHLLLYKVSFDGYVQWDMW